MCTHNLCFEQKYEKYQNFLSKNFHLLVVKFSVYMNRHILVMRIKTIKKYLQFSIRSPARSDQIFHGWEETLKRLIETFFHGRFNDLK